jgi:hypothetical protein
LGAGLERTNEGKTGEVDAETYDTRRRSQKELRCHCQGYKKVFTVRSGTVFASHNLPVRRYLAAIQVSCETAGCLAPGFA